MLRNMSKIPGELLYTAEHEWVKLLDGGEALVGITDHAQSSLGDITFVDLPDEGAAFDKGETFGAVESVKAASDLYMPLKGEVLEVNADLDATPEVVNNDPYTGGWLIKIKVADASEVESLLDPAAYEKVL